MPIVVAVALGSACSGRTREFGPSSDPKLEKVKFADIQMAPGIATDLVPGSTRRMVLPFPPGQEASVAMHALSQVPPGTNPIAALQRAFDELSDLGWVAGSEICYPGGVGISLGGQVKSTYPGTSKWQAGGSLALSTSGVPAVGPVSTPFIEFDISVPVGTAGPPVGVVHPTPDVIGACPAGLKIPGLTALSGAV